MNEVWKDIIGFEGIYQISNLARVKSLARDKPLPNGGCIKKEDTILKPILSGDKYHVVNLCNGGVSRTVRVHRLLAIHFIPNPDNKPYINHKDVNRINNTLDNIEWCTHDENMAHGVRLKLFKATYTGRGKFNELHPSSKKVIQMDLLGNEIKVWPSVSQIYRDLNYWPSFISQCARGIFQMAYGYKWRYAL